METTIMGHIGVYRVSALVTAFGTRAGELS